MVEIHNHVLYPFKTAEKELPVLDTIYPDLNACLEVTNIHSNHESSQKAVQTCRFFVPKCTLCNEEMQFVEGDIIYGDKWYHDSCWDNKKT